MPPEKKEQRLAKNVAYQKAHPRPKRHLKEDLSKLTWTEMTKGQRISAAKYGLVPPVRSDRERQLRYRYNLLAEDYEVMFAAQDGKCAICLQTWHRDLYVDHNHTTNQVRELLCNPCNALVGVLEESPKRLVQALTYLDKHGLGTDDRPHTVLVDQSTPEGP